jgi:hypothetical protein
MYSYKNSPKEKIENIDLQVVIFGIQLVDLSQLFIIYAVFYYVVNSIFAGIATVVAYFFFRFLEDRRSRQVPFELNRAFSTFCKNFRMIGDYFHSSAHVEFEEEVYRE